MVFVGVPSKRRLVGLNAAGMRVGQTLRDRVSLVGGNAAKRKGVQTQGETQGVPIRHKWVRSLTNEIATAYSIRPERLELPAF